MEPITPMVENRSQKQKKIYWNEIIVIILLLGLGAFLFYQGYNYLDMRLKELQEATEANVLKALNEVQATNALNIKHMEEQMEVILSEMEEIKYILSQTDQSIGVATITQVSLSKHIEELESQLNELQRGMEMLQNAFNKKN
jgi:uncharacterized coiled-coil protein SlyX